MLSGPGHGKEVHHQRFGETTFIDGLQRILQVPTVLAEADVRLVTVFPYHIAACLLSQALLSGRIDMHVGIDLQGSSHLYLQYWAPS